MNAKAIVNRLLESELRVTRKSLQPDIERAFAFLRKRNPTGYAQAATAAFSRPPAYADDDPNCDWWFSQEAVDTLQMLRDGAHEGVKPPEQNSSDAERMRWRNTHK